MLYKANGGERDEHDKIAEDDSRSREELPEFFRKAWHALAATRFLAAGFLLGLGYGILQPLFQSLVTSTTPAEKRGAANATYLLSYDIGIGIGSFAMGMFQESIGLASGFARTAQRAGKLFVNRGSLRNLKNFEMVF